MAAGRDHLRAIMNAALEAVEAGDCVRRCLRTQGSWLGCGERRWRLDDDGRVLVGGAGKATAAMAEAIEEILGRRIAAGTVVVKEGHGLPLRRIVCREAGHPLPDQRGVEATREILAHAHAAGADDLVVCLLSGGASALLVAPASGITLDDLRATDELLLASGMPIRQINAVRKHLSEVTGGRLARAAAPAPVLALILSDVIGNPLDAIASGPTVGDPTTYGDCLDLLAERRLMEAIPEAVRDHLRSGAAGGADESPSPGAAEVAGVHNVVVGDIGDAVEAALQAARRLGYRARSLGEAIEGEARDVGRALAASARAAREGVEDDTPVCLVGGGEPTVRVRGDGLGGRNQEVALAAALELDGVDGITIAVLGTDGTDGMTEAAGAFADGFTVRRGRAAGLEASDHLRRNDSNPFFAAVDDLIVTGPTRTNVMDLQIALVRAPGPA